MTNSNNEGRDGSGRFLKGHGKPGPGRPPGTENKTTCDLRTLRRQIASSWDRVDGDRLLDELAQSDFVAYAKLVIGIVPKGLDIVPPEEMRQVRVVIGRGRTVGDPYVDNVELDDG